MSLTRQLEDANSRLQSGIAFLASVGSTAPFVGLFEPCGAFCKPDRIALPARLRSTRSPVRSVRRSS